MLLAYRMTIFLSAFLLFQIQLIAGKYLLPWFGGTPAVFTACMLFFQFGLILAYYYADVVRGKSPWRGTLIHFSVLALSLAFVAARMSRSGSAITPDESWKAAEGPPLLVILGLLAGVTGLPYFVLGTTGPLLQSWHARLKPGEGVYRTYALSNAGSVLGLITYPFGFERVLRLQTQARLWSALYVVFALSCAAAAFLMARAGKHRTPASRETASEGPPPRTGRQLQWFALAGCACAMLMAVTNQICQNVAAVPLLWVLPLTIYLLSLIACFESRRWYRLRWWSLALGVSTVVISIVFRHGTINPFWQIGIYLFALLTCCMVCHGEAVRLKPSPAYLTRFYLLIAAGAAAGSAFVVLLAPLLFTTYFWELHLALWLTWIFLALARLTDEHSWVRERKPWLLVVTAAVICAGILDNSTSRGGAIFLSSMVLVLTGYLFTGPGQATKATIREAAIRSGLALALLGIFLPVFAFAQPVAAIRNFYGILTVLSGSEQGQPLYTLKHGQILHGAQFLSKPLRAVPTAYYGPKSGVGLLLINHPRRLTGQPLRVGVVGLGAGTLAAYGKSGDYFRFYEINPANIRLAFSGTPPLFTFLRDSPARIDVVEGDARIRLEQELRNHQPQRFDVLVLDAFSGDAIPVHLLTQEAFRIYAEHLNGRDAVLAFHISNRAVDLRPVLSALAATYNFRAFLVEGGNTLGAGLSSWVLMTRDVGTLSAFVDAKSELAGMKHVLWTDDFSNLFQVIK